MLFLHFYFILFFFRSVSLLLGFHLDSLCRDSQLVKEVLLLPYLALGPQGRLQAGRLHREKEPVPLTT